MVNEQVVNYMTSENWGQYTQAFKFRTSFTPGKATSRPQDENWPRDFKVPVVGQVTTIFHGRVSKIGRNIICNQEQDYPPIITGERGRGQTTPATAAEWAILNA